jgi:hypothetical protein
MDATPDGIALGGSRQAGARRLVVLASVALALVSGVVIGRETGAHPSVLPHRTTFTLSTAGPESQNARTRLKVMEKMNSLRPAPPRTERDTR